MRPNRTSYGPPATGDELDRLIRIVADLAAILRRSVEAGLAGTGVTPPTRALMATLQDNGPRPVPKLGLALGVTRQAVQPLVDALVAEGRAELLPNAGNRRSPLVRLTDAGAEAFAAIRAAEMRQVWRIAAQYPRTEIASTRRIITSLRRSFAAANGVQTPDQSAED